MLVAPPITLVPVPSDPADILRSVPGFSSLSAGELGRVVASMREQRLPAGLHLFRRGDPGSTMVVVLDGVLAVHTTRKGGTPATIDLGAGAVIGEIALLAGTPRNADVVVRQPARVLIAERDVIHALVAEHPAMARFLTELLGRRLDEGGIDHVGKYTLFDKLGQGASGRVYDALHPILGRPVAIKMLSHQLVWRPELRQRFLREARIVASLDHPNIVSVYDIEDAWATLCLVMERIDGIDLRALLDRCGRLAFPQALHVLRQLCAGLRHAHQRGIVHRDIKPANVALTRSGHLKLMDFGLATTYASTEGGTGTPHYVAPEIAREQLADHRADIYSLGIMAFELVTGRRPFNDGTPQQVLAAHVLLEPLALSTLAPDAPAGLATFVTEALQKDPDDRIDDWDRIEALLGAGSPSGRSAQLRWTDAADPRVRSTLHALGRVDGVTVDAGAAPLPEGQGWITQAVLAVEA